MRPHHQAPRTGLPIPARLSHLEATLDMSDVPGTLPARLAAIEVMVHGDAQEGDLLTRIAALEAVCGVMDGDIARITAEYGGSAQPLS